MAIINTLQDLLHTVATTDNIKVSLTKPQILHNITLQLFRQETNFYNKLKTRKWGQSPTCRPPGMRIVQMCIFYLSTDH